jgi:hypothetical protein
MAILDCREAFLEPLELFRSFSEAKGVREVDA